MSIPTFTLRAYQDLNVSRIVRRILQDGKQHVLYAAPMASGKTLVGKALAARLLGPRFSTVLILGPSNNIVERWREPVKVASVARNMPPRVYGKTLDRDGKLPRLDTAQALHADGSFWSGEDETIRVGTRQGVCDQKVIDLLIKMKHEGLDVEHLCVLVDEGHHHFKENQGGKFCKAITDLGGTVVLLTGTPWHSAGALTDENSGEVHYPWSPYARETDEQGRLIAPQNWRVEHERVQECETDDLSLVVDDGFEAKGDFSDAKRKVMIKRIVDRFVADGCPKLVVNVPRRSPWVTDLMGALQRSTKVRNALKALKRPALRVFDFTGGSTDDATRIAELEKLMFEDAEKCTHYCDSKIDVIVACARMNEGTDWPLCSHVYNVRIPNSMSLIMQRWSRASRSKNKYTGYPADYANTQTLVFFSPTVTGDAGANFWAKHRNIALATASLLEDYRVTQKYVNVCPSFERFKKAVESGNQPDIDDAGNDLLDDEDHDQEWEGTEHGRAQAMAKVVEFIERRGGEVSVPELAAFIKSKAKGDKELATELRQAAIVHLERVNPEIATLVREHRTKSRARVSRSGDCGGDLIKRDMEDAWEAVAAKFSHVMVSTPEDFAKQVAMFTPEDAPQLAERLREGDTKGDAVINALEIVTWSVANGGSWPTRGSENSEESRLARALTNLRARHPDICAQYHIPVRFRSEDYLNQLASRIVKWAKSHAEIYPRTTATDPEEKRLGHAINNLRSRHPDVCAHYDIPLREDKSESLRIALNKEQFTTLGQLLPRLCRSFRASQKTQNIEGDSGEALNSALRLSRVNPSASRGLGYAPDLCQVDSIARANDEIEHDCWRFTLKGAKKPDRRKWAALLASGDNSRIESAQRIAFLDWENPEGNPITLLDPKGRYSSLATRRPWSLPVAKAS